MVLSLAQINMSRCSAGMEELRHYFQNSGIDIMMIQEPYAKHGLRWPGCKIYHGASPDEDIWTLTIVRDSIEGVVLHTRDSTSNCTVISVTLSDTSKITLANSYFQYSEGIEGHLAQLDKVLEGCGNNMVIIVADANAKSPLWFNEVSDEKGRKLEEFILMYDLTVCNTEHALTTYDNTRGAISNIDVTLSKGLGQYTVERWNIERQSFLTDHRLVTFGIDMKRSNRITKTSLGSIPKHSNIKNHDWRKFDVALLVDLGDTLDFEARPLEEKVSELTRIILRAEYEAATPSQSKRVSPRWWCEDLQKMKRKKNAAERRWRKLLKVQPTVEEVILRARLEFVNIRTQYVNKIRFLKRQDWLECIKVSSDEDPWGAAYKILSGKIKRPTQMVALQTELGILTDPTKIAKTMLFELLPDDSVIGDTEEHRRIRSAAREVIPLGDPIGINLEQLRAAVARQKNGKAPGVDGIRAEVLKRSLGRVEPLLLNIARDMFISGQYPRQWKLGELKVFLKSPDKPKDSVRSYRPITLLPVMGKVIERVMASKLTEWLSSIGYFGPSQHGFVAGKSTITAMTGLCHYVKNAERRIVLGLFLDISGAFDNAWWPMVIHLLKSHGCPNSLMRLLQSYLSEREVVFNWEGIHVRKTLTKGCPQGSILGPLLWNILFEDLLRVDIGATAQMIAYADDAVILVQGDSRVDIENKTNAAVKKVVEWSKRAKLSFSVPKTQALILKGKFHRYRKPIIKMNEHRVATVENLRYLGVLVSENLNFAAHINAMTERLKKVFMSFYTLSKTSNGYSCLSLRILYKGLFQPLATYGCEMWGPVVLRNKNVMRTMISVQRQILIRVCKAYRTISADACCVVAGVIPIDLLVKERINIFEDVKNGIVRTESKRDRRVETLDAWQGRWTQSDKGRETYLYFPSIRERLKLHMDWDHYATQYLSGHGNFYAKLHYFKLKQSPYCPLCEEDTEDTAWHTLAQCLCLSLERAEIQEILTDNPVEDRRNLVADINFKKFTNTARRIGKKKEDLLRSQI